jgi:hypothetical protein
MTCFIAGDVIAQQERPNYFLKTTKRGDPLSNTPSPESERFKMNCVAPKDTNYFTMSFREYVDGKKREEYKELEEIYHGRYTKGDKFSWEVVPDVSDRDTFRLFVNFPVMYIRRMKIINAGKCFKYAPYQPIEHTGQTDEIPLMLIYEDDIATPETEKFVKKYTTDGKLSPDAAKNKALLSKIKRYVILLYTLN